MAASDTIRSGGNATLRRAHLRYRPAIEALVSGVVDECYGHLLTSTAADPTAGWERGWVAEIGGTIVGVMLTEGAWLEDLWILTPARGLGIGSRLLAQAEKDIAARGYALARLRVVAENAAAQRFYDRRGWRELRRYPHEQHQCEWSSSPGHWAECASTG